MLQPGGVGPLSYVLQPGGAGPLSYMLQPAGAGPLSYVLQPGGAGPLSYVLQPGGARALGAGTGKVGRSPAVLPLSPDIRSGGWLLVVGLLVVGSCMSHAAEFETVSAVTHARTHVQSPMAALI